MMDSPAGVALMPLSISDVPPRKGSRLLVDGHQVSGLPADHPSRLRYEESMGLRSGPAAAEFAAAEGPASPATGAAASAASPDSDPDDPTVLHRPSAVDVTVPAPPTRADPRMLVLPSRPLEMGQCGAPVLDAFDSVIGMVESTLTAAHGELAGAGVCVTGARLAGLVEAVSRRLLAGAKRAAEADGITGGSGARGPAAPISAWGAGGAGSPYGEKPRRGGAGEAVAAPLEALLRAEEDGGSDAVRALSGPAGQGSAGTTFSALAAELHGTLTGRAGRAASLAVAASRAAGVGWADADEAGARAAWLCLAEGLRDEEEAAEAACAGSRQPSGAVAGGSAASRWGLSAEHASRLATVLGSDRRPDPGASVAREVAHSAALAAHFAEDALSEDGAALPLAHRVALSARDAGHLSSWVFAVDHSSAGGAWEALGLDPPVDGGRISVAPGTPGAGRAAPRAAAAAELRASVPRSAALQGEEEEGVPGVGWSGMTPPAPTSLDSEEAKNRPSGLLGQPRRRTGGLKQRYSSRDGAAERA